jgi:hypothetical protein
MTNVGHLWGPPYKEAPKKINVSRWFLSEKKDLQNFDGLKPHFPIQLP